MKQSNSRTLVISFLIPVIGFFTLLACTVYANGPKRSDLAPTQAKTRMDRIYIDNNNMVCYSALLDHIPAKMTIKGAKVNIPQGVKRHATVELNYPMTAITQIYKEGDKFRVVVWGIRFDAGRLSMPIESFSMSGRKLTRNKERLMSVKIVRNFLDSYFGNHTL